MKRILAATDGSEGASRALDAAIELARTCSAELLLVNVEQGYLDEATDEFREVENASIDEILYSVSAEILSRAEERAKKAGIVKVRTVSGLGDAVGFILQTSEAESVDLIVVGRRGRGRIAGLLLGSVSQKLASLASCKVLVVP